MARINCSAATAAVFICLSAISAHVSGEPEWAHRIVELLREKRLVNCERDSTNFQVDRVFGVLFQCLVRCKGHVAKVDYKQDGAPCNTPTMERGACQSGVCKKLTTSSAVLPITTGRPKQDLAPFIPERDPGTTVLGNSKHFRTEATSSTRRIQTSAPATSWATTVMSTFDNNDPTPLQETMLQSTESAPSRPHGTTGSVLTIQRSVLSEATTRHQKAKPDSQSPNFVTQISSSVVASVEATSSESVPVTFHFSPIRETPTEGIPGTPVQGVDAVSPWPYIIITDFAYKFAPPARLRPSASDPFGGEAL